MVDISCRRASEDDLPAILSLYDQLETDDRNPLSLVEAQQLFRRIESYPNYHIYVATCENQVVGTFALLIMDNLAHCGTPSGVVEDVVVSVDWQGRGIGKQMMQYALDQCSDHGCYKLALSSGINRENAHRFYESLHFKQHGISFVTFLD